MKLSLSVLVSVFVSSRSSCEASLPGMNHDAAHLLLRLACISTPYYLPQRDISNPLYKPQPRIVYGKYDYDEIVKH